MEFLTIHTPLKLPDVYYINVLPTVILAIAVFKTCRCSWFEAK